MRIIAHLSDLHFGRLHEPTRNALLRAVSEIRPDLVAVSGDLTQRARISQFKAAQAFLNEIPFPKIVVPGNHDVPAWNLFLRFRKPFARFQRYITDDLSPEYIDDEIAVLGINTARSLAFAGGRVNRRQVTETHEQFCGLEGRKTRIVVTHHPFDLPMVFSHLDLAGRSRMAMEQFAQCGVDLFLAGHYHFAHAGNTARFNIPGYSALVVQAGTTTSTRVRGEVNSFNLIRIDPPVIGVETYAWNSDRQSFEVTRTKKFRKKNRAFLAHTVR
ncbi:MAG: metallophosphoesterase family protein [Candidatus Latescibacterota bacterium]